MLEGAWCEWAIAGVTTAGVLGEVVGSYATEAFQKATDKLRPKHNYNLEKLLAAAFKQAALRLWETEETEEGRRLWLSLSDNAATLVPEGADFPADLVDAFLFGYPYSLSEVLTRIIQPALSEVPEPLREDLSAKLPRAVVKQAQELLKETEHARGWNAFVRELLWECHGLLVEQSEKLDGIAGQLSALSDDQKQAQAAQMRELQATRRALKQVIQRMEAPLPQANGDAVAEIQRWPEAFRLVLRGELAFIKRSQQRAEETLTRFEAELTRLTAAVREGSETTLLVGGMLETVVVEQSEKTRDFVAELLAGQAARDRQAAGERAPVWVVPYPRNTFFTGRADILAQLSEALTQDGVSAITQAIAGLGGVGKTQTAIEFAYRCREQEPGYPSYRDILWASANTELTLVTEFGRLAQALDLPQKDAPEAEVVREAVTRWLAENDDYLLVLDNVDSPEVLAALRARFLPPAPQGDVLVTSRLHTLALPHLKHPLELHTLPLDEATAFLLERAGRADGGAAERQEAEALAKELDGLPLALEQAAAYIAAGATRFADYRAAYRKRRLSLLERQKPEWGDAEKTVARTWQISFEAVQAVSEASAELLRLSAFFAPDAIPEEILIGGASELGDLLSDALADAEEDPLVLDELLKPLLTYSLIRRDTDARTYRIHRLVQEVIRTAMDDPTRKQTAEHVVLAINQTFPDIEFSNWSDCARLLPHAQLCSEHIRHYGLESVEVARLLNQTGYYLSERAKYAEAEPLYEQALALRQKSLPEGHPDIAQSLNNLAGLYQAQGRYSEAEPLLKQALVIHRKSLPEGHPDIARSLNNLAGLYFSQGRYTEAEPLLRQASEIDRVALGENHPDYATDLNNLAGLYDTQHRYAEAELLHLQALAIRRHSLPEGHPDIAQSLNNIANMYSDQGRYMAAEPLYLQALKILRASLPEGHPRIAACLSNLALCYKLHERHADAEPLYREALEIDRLSLGENHPDYAIDLNNLAGLYYAQSRYEEAEPLLKQALAIVQKALGENHPNTILYCNNYAYFLRTLGREKEAQEVDGR